MTSDELGLATPNTPHFREYQQQKEPLRALLCEPFLLREDNSGTKQETLYFLRNMGLSLDELNVIAVMDDAASLIRCITLGMGVPSCRARPCRTMRSQADCCCFRRAVGLSAQALHRVSVRAPYVGADETFSGFHEGILSDRTAAGMSLTIAPRLRTLTAAFRTARRNGTAVSPLIASARTHTPCTSRSAHIIPSP
mgnify:CR=1 FL=1